VIYYAESRRPVHVTDAEDQPSSRTSKTGSRL
jgi:hypothetical protein